MSLLEVRGLCKSFGKTSVLSDISFCVEQGDCLAMLGPSGVGKTTLLRCLNFLERADSGTFTFDRQSFDLGTITNRDIARIRRQTGFVFQEFNLFLNKTVLGNVLEGLVTARRVPMEQAVLTAREALERVGMRDKEDAYPSNLSGGQKQRAAIARAIALSPKILYFDEPTSALDPSLTGEVLSVMRALSKDGMTMLVVTHEMAFARDVSNRVLFIDGGQIVEDEASEAFFNKPKTSKGQQFIGMYTRGTGEGSSFLSPKQEPSPVPH